MNRRTFLKAAAGVVAGLVAGRVSAPAQAEAAEPVEEMSGYQLVGYPQPFTHVSLLANESPQCMPVYYFTGTSWDRIRGSGEVNIGR